ncbi:Jag family protein [Enemella evansiae]|uniref:RNA-binding protein n=1 Tax=Enemella evansiae TaxID=2016499 RepID=A0A255GNK3_9ACTN|nr:R3H domain-containing nucleic acid-binding protein [Enemella evansiae]OYO14161.1 RNA-binding protein [Enemella evansiae]OYO17400.1 RNA-binding protein [Enemella evansiae]TDO91948.1 spoIIIJ-associated protein [Enemella evansiae]
MSENQSQTHTLEAEVPDGAEVTEEKVTEATTVETPEASETTDDGEENTGERRSNKQAVLDEEGDIAADYLEELLDIADLDGDIDTYTEGGRAHVSIVTEGNVLVGKDGEVLDALQELSRLAVMTETGRRSRLMLDVAGHRDKRRAELTDLANDAIEEVKSSGEQVRLSPMNPFERKIVHDVVAAAGLVSESDGEEPNRRVVVLPN